MSITTDITSNRAGVDCTMRFDGVDYPVTITQDALVMRSGEEYDRDRYEAMFRDNQVFFERCALAKYKAGDFVEGVGRPRIEINASRSDEVNFI